MATPFRVIVYNAAGTAQGELLTVSAVSDTRSLDKIGTLEFALSANDPHIAYVTAGSQFDVYDEIDGYIGRFIFKTSSINATANIPEMTVRADEVLVELRWALVGFKRNYYLSPVDYVVSDLTRLASGWTAEVDLNIGDTAVNYQGESVFAAIDVMRDRWGQHFRRKTINSATPRVLQFGAFGVDSGLILNNLEGQSQPSFNMRRYVAEVQTIKQDTSADDIVNLVVALGAGQGVGQLTIQNATGGTYAVQSAVNQDDSLYYYISDAASIATYGVRARVVTFSGITPLSNNATDIQRAKNALKAAAEAYMVRHLTARVEYGVTVAGLRQNVDVGDTVRLRYRGVTQNVVWINVDSDFYLMDITRSRTAKGDRSAKMTITTVSDRRTSDSDVMVDVVRDISVLKLHMQPQVWWSENTYIEPICAPSNIADYQTMLIQSDIGYSFAVRWAHFKISIDNSVTAIHKAILRLRTRPPYSLIRAELNGAGTMLWNSYAVFQGTNYPYRVYIFIDGVDYTAQLGGPWGLTNAEDNATLDITDIINSYPEIRRDYQIEFRCWGRQGDPVFAESGAITTPTPTDDSISIGLIELNIRLQGTAQAVIAS